jgi:hypothetical protein
VTTTALPAEDACPVQPAAPAPAVAPTAGHEAFPEPNVPLATGAPGRWSARTGKGSAHPRQAPAAGPGDCDEARSASHSRCPAAPTALPADIPEESRP